ncbi:MAG: hypothetical protein VB859_19865, partial [Planctomycetaceae bacterium]
AYGDGGDQIVCDENSILTSPLRLAWHQQEPQSRDDNQPLPLAPIPEEMDTETIKTLFAEPHSTQGMMPELELLPRTGLYYCSSRVGPSADEFKEYPGIYFNLKLVRQRFLVRMPHQPFEKNFEGVSIWTYDREQQAYRNWLGTREGTFVETRGKADPDQQSIDVKSVDMSDEGGGTLVVLYVVHNDKEKFQVKGRYSSDGEAKVVWEAEFYRKGEVGEVPPANAGHWIENNLALFMVLVHGSWITATITLIIILRRVGRRREEKRTSDFQAVAVELDLTFLSAGDEALEQRLSGFPLFNTGRDRKLSNLIVADTPEVQIALFDYRYVTGHGKNKRTRQQSVAVVQSTELRLPEFHLRPEKALDVVGSLLGLQDIDFDHHPDFSRAFVLKSGSEEETREFFDQELLDFLAARREISFEATRGMFVCFRRWKRVEPQTAAMREFLGEGLQLVQALQERLSRP